TRSVALKLALEELSYGPVYHGEDGMLNDASTRQWYKALRSKYHGEGEPFRKKDFDRIFCGFQVVSDMPAVAFPDELIQAYPNAKVILTLRDIDKWHKSFIATVYASTTYIMSIAAAYVANILLSPTRWSLPVAIMFFNGYFRGDFPNNGKTVFIEHYQHIRDQVSQDRLLEFDIRDGWKPLCEFLNMPIPNHAFPNSNEKEAVNKKIRMIINNEICRSIKISCILILLASLTYSFYRL
ncbi:NAD dependent epimerase, partial [Hyaloscypha finlandica]